MTPLDNAITAIGDVMEDLYSETTAMWSSEGKFATPHILSHLGAAREMLRRIRTEEDKAHGVVGLFDQEEE